MQLTTLTKKSFKGFTLIELLVVIAIIGLLSTIVAAPVQSARKKAKDVKKVAEIKQVQTALANFANDNGQFPAASSTAGSARVDLSALTPQYIPSIPTSITTSAGSAKDKTMYIAYRGLAPSALPSSNYGTSTFGYHLGVSLEVFNTVLADDNDCWGVISATTSGQLGLRNGGPCVNFIVQATSSLGASAAVYFGASTTPFVGPTAVLPSGVVPTGSPMGWTGTVPVVFESYAHLAHSMLPTGTSDFYGKGSNESASSSCATIDMCIFDVADSY